jgi:protein TonB
VIGGVLSSAPVAMPSKVTPQRVRVSQGVTSGLLMKKVTPQYPPLARQARIQGSVVLHAVIGKNGEVQNLQVVSGHPMLTQAAIQAVKQWKYKPYYLNGQPVEVDTNITVNFSLAGA